MRRTDRLFSIIQLLRRKKVVTAATLAERLEVSERTIYRDIRDLVLSGTPVEGEAGVGYRLRAGYDLPPLMFDENEIEALVIGARIVASVADEELASGSRSALAKVETILPRNLAARLGASRLYAPGTHVGRRIASALKPIRSAAAAKKKLRFRYTREDGAPSSRVVRPLGAFFWGQVWTLGAWCELRNDFRNFRLDRMTRIEVLETSFSDEPGRSLRDYLLRYGERGLELIEGRS